MIAFFLRSNWVVASLVLVVFPIPSWGANDAGVDSSLSVPPTWIQGHVSTGLWFPTEAPGATASQPGPNWNLRQSQLSLWLEARPELSENWKLHSVGTFDAIPQTTVWTTAGQVTEGVRATFREGYFQYFRGAWDFRIGRQRIAWGKSDGINPTDFFSRKSQYLLWSDEEAKRFGVDAVSLTWIPQDGASPWSFQAVMSPRYGRTESLLSTRLTGGSIVVAESSYANDGVSRDLNDTGARVSYFGRGYDWDFLFFSGRRRVPRLGWVSPTEINTRYEKILGLGTNGSFNLRSPAWLGGGEWLVRWEGALQKQTTQALEMPLNRPLWWDSVLGVERFFAEQLRVQTQWVYRRILTFEQPGVSMIPGVEALRRINAVVQGMLYRERHAATVRLSYEPEGSRWRSEVFTLAYFAPGEGLIQPRVTFSPRDAVSMSVGAVFFAGPQDQAFGALRDYRSIFTEARWDF